MRSAYAGAYVETELVYDVAQKEVVTDAAGKETLKTKPQKVKAYLKAPKRPDVRAQIGADVVLVSYEGRLTNPSQPPSALVTGTIVRFKMDGRSVKGRLIVFPPSPMKGLDKIQGRKIQVVGSG